MRCGLVAGVVLALAAQGVFAVGSARADPAYLWEMFIDDGGPDDLTESDWRLVDQNHSMGVGVAAWVKYAVAWRKDSEVGAFMHYHYDPPVSPPELPGPGPMSDEYVEVTINCADHTSRIHTMHLFRQNSARIGTWFDPDSAEHPSAYDPGSLVGRTAQGVC